MSKELLKKCRAAIEVHCVTHDQEAKRSLLAEIDTELAKPEPEPVGWLYEVKEANKYVWERRISFVAPPPNNEFDTFRNETPLYTSPPARKLLSDQKLLQLWREYCGKGYEAYARAIEKAHGIT